jgi:hypothetical protein
MYFQKKKYFMNAIVRVLLINLYLGEPIRSNMIHTVKIQY